MRLGHILITGGSGFIGAHLVAQTLENAKSVTVADLHPSSIPGVRHVVVDIRDREALLTQLPKQIDTIFHLAARTSVLQSINDPQGVFETNVAGTQNVLEFARNADTARILIASTNAVVGNHAEGRIVETSPLNPLTPYGSTKAAAELLSRAYFASYGLTATALRLTNVYGEGMSKKDSIVPRLLKTALGESTFAVYGDGEQFRDYVYVGDVAKAFVDLAGIGHQGPVIIGSGTSISVNTLVGKACQVTGIDIAFSRVEPQSGEMRGVSVDTSLASSLGIVCATPIDDGLARTWNDFKSTRFS